MDLTSAAKPAEMHRRFVSIWLPRLATDWFIAKQPRLRGVAFALKVSANGRMVLTAISPKAEAGGLSAGMSLADAKSLLPSLEVFDDRPNLTNQLLQRITEWSIRFTPGAAPDPPHGILIDATGCTHLWGSEAVYLDDITKRLAGRGYTAHAAIAGTIGTAWAVARYGKETRVIKEGCNRQALLSLPPAALRLEAAVVQRLHKLGLRSVGDFISISTPSLHRRFGQHTVLRIAQALGTVEEGFTPALVQQPFEERLPAPEPIVTRTGIEIALERLLQSLCDRLHREGKGLRRAIFRCYRIDSSTQGLEIATSRPSQNKEHLFQLFSLKLGVLEPQCGIELFMLQADTVEDYTPAQESLWQGGGVKDVEVLSELIDRIRGRFGEDILQKYLPAEHHLPELSYQKAISLTEQQNIHWRMDKPRPLQLLHSPEVIEVTAPIPDYPPMNFRHNGVLHTVVKADGPERIEQEWWIREGEHRDYYSVEDEQGRRYWIFRSGHYNETRKPQWFLHGYFA